MKQTAADGYKTKTSCNPHFVADRLHLPYTHTNNNILITIVTVILREAELGMLKSVLQCDVLITFLAELSATPTCQRVLLQTTRWDL